MSVNLTELQSSNNLVDIISFVNTNSGGFFSAFILLAFFFILFFNLRRYGTNDALLASGFACFIVSIFFKSAGLINFQIVILFFVLTFMGIIFKYMTE